MSCSWLLSLINHVLFSLQTRAKDLRLTEEARRRLAGKFTFTVCRLPLGTRASVLVYWMDDRSFRAGFPTLTGLLTVLSVASKCSLGSAQPPVWLVLGPLSIEVNPSGREGHHWFVSITVFKNE